MLLTNRDEGVWTCKEQITSKRYSKFFKMYPVRIEITLRNTKVYKVDYGAFCAV